MEKNNTVYSGNALWEKSSILRRNSNYDSSSLLDNVNTEDNGYRWYDTVPSITGESEN